VLSGRGLCDEVITRPEESYRLVCRVWSRNHKNPREWGGGQDPLGGYRAKKKEEKKSGMYEICGDWFHNERMRCITMVLLCISWVQDRD